MPLGVVVIVGKAVLLIVGVVVALAVGTAVPLIERVRVTVTVLVHDGEGVVDDVIVAVIVLDGVLGGV